MIYCFDLDGTLCSNTDGNYSEAEPFLDRISYLNDLHRAGHKIIIETARGSVTGIEWHEVTRSQLLLWGVLYDELRTGIKYNADVYVDDKCVKDTDFFNYYK